MNPPFNSRPFNPAWKTPIPPYDDTTNKHPNVVIAIGLVGYGYQVDYYMGGQLVQTSCRDFGGSYPIKKLEERFLLAIERAIDGERSKL